MARYAAWKNHARFWLVKSHFFHNPLENAGSPGVQLNIFQDAWITRCTYMPDITQGSWVLVWTRVDKITVSQLNHQTVGSRNRGSKSRDKRVGTNNRSKQRSTIQGHYHDTRSPHKFIIQGHDTGSPQKDTGPSRKVIAHGHYTGSPNRVIEHGHHTVPSHSAITKIHRTGPSQRIIMVSIQESWHKQTLSSHRAITQCNIVSHATQSVKQHGKSIDTLSQA